MTLRPAPAHHGVRFLRKDARDHLPLLAHHQNVINTFHATSIGLNGVSVSTIEHLMAALYGSGVDNVLVELDGPEVPIFDGSAGPYLDLIREAGLQEQDAFRRCLCIQKTLVVNEGKAFIKASPSNRFHVRYGIEFAHPLVGKQELTWTFSPRSFGIDIAPARTFGFLKDVQKLQSMGLAQGGSLQNAVVFDDFNILNSEGFRYKDECVRHKILDFIGDLALAGLPLVGRFEVYRAGHSLHSLFLKQLLAKPGTCRIFTPVSYAPPFIPSAALAPFMESLPHSPRTA